MNWPLAVRGIRSGASPHRVHEPLGFNRIALIGFGGRGWVRTSDPCRVKAVLSH